MVTKAINAFPPVIVKVAGDGQPRYALVVNVTPTIGAKDIRESTTPAQREARATELKAAAEEKARLRTAAGKKDKKGKSQQPVVKTNSEVPSGGKLVAGALSISKEAKDAAKNSGCAAMTGLSTSLNTNASKNARKKEKKRQAKKQREAQGGARQGARLSHHRRRQPPRTRRPSSPPRRSRPQAALVSTRRRRTTRD